MKIGIVSDSHGGVSRLKTGLEILLSRGAEAVVHCGDVSTLAAVEALGQLPVPTYLVLGNMDRHGAELVAVGRECGVRAEWETVEIPLGDGRHLIATHGHDESLLGELIAGEQFAYVCHGHTHCTRDETFGKTRAINPGALAHPKNPRYATVALLDPDLDTVEHIRVPR